MSAFRFFFFPLLLVALAACSSVPKQKSFWRVEQNGDAIHDAILAHHDDWQGTPYQLGGTDRSGIDCSAYMQVLFSDQFRADLPRTTLEQMRLGEAVSRRDLQAGDLVFFSPSSKSRHVGVYLSDGYFVHAGSGSGVTVSHLDQSYWLQSYTTARRVLLRQ